MTTKPKPKPPVAAKPAASHCYCGGTFWTPDMVKRLVELRRKGMTTSQIADDLGLSRGSVAGKWSRLTEAEKMGKIPMVQPLLDRPNLPQRLQLRNMDWSLTSCSWPEGDPQEGDFHFCGADIVAGRPYCDRHCGVAYTSMRDTG